MKIEIEKFLDDSEIKEIIKRETISLIRESINTQVRSMLVQKASEIIDKELDKQIRRTFEVPFIVDNGWGDRKEYASFDGLFKERLNKELTGYNVTRKADELVKNYVQETMKDSLESLKEQLLKISIKKVGKDE